MPFSPAALEELKTVLYTAVLSDVLDSLGFTRQAMRPFVRPLDDNSILCGRARTGLFSPVYAVSESENPYELEIALLDDLRPGDVAVFACNGPTDRIAPWGELLTTAAMQRQAAGCVTDGLVRDVRHIRKQGFPLFHGGIGPLDSRGRGKMTAMDTPVECAGAPVVTGDLVFGDVDGVVIIPARMEQQVIEIALEKVKGENSTRDELLRGAYLRDVYAKYGIL